MAFHHECFEWLFGNTMSVYARAKDASRHLVTRVEWKQFCSNRQKFVPIVSSCIAFSSMIAVRNATSRNCAMAAPWEISLAQMKTKRECRNVYNLQIHERNPENGKERIQSFTLVLSLFGRFGSHQKRDTLYLIGDFFPRAKPADVFKLFKPVIGAVLILRRFRPLFKVLFF